MSRVEDKSTIIVVGNGMVGYKLCEYLVDGRAPGERRIICFGEEPRPAYDRVALTSYFSGATESDLQLADAAWYRKNGIELRTGERVAEIDRAAKTVTTSTGQTVAYDSLVLATGSAPFVPPVDGVDLPGVFVYRTIEDLDAIKAYAANSSTAAVVGGGLL